MTDETNVVEIRGGVADVTSGDVFVIDWDNDIDYDLANFLISTILVTCWDGPTQM